MSFLASYRCLSCDAALPAEPEPTLCPSCGGNLEAQMDLARIGATVDRDRLAAEQADIRKYRAFFPAEISTELPLVRVGATPLYQSAHLAEQLGLSKLLLKDETKNPSASFKDRAGAMILWRALERGEKTICAASTGNAASSLACLAAGSGLRSVIFVPKTAPAGKLAQLQVFGAQLLAVNGTYDQAFELSIAVSKACGWYNRNTGYNPLTREGKKTASFELAEQTGFALPDWLVVPVGDGNIISGIWKGLREFKTLGWINKVPRLLAAQAIGSNAVTRAFATDGEIPTVSGETVADSISVSLPRDGHAAVLAVRESAGAAIAVDDKAILAAIPTLARASGIFVEPAAAVTLPALQTAIANGVVKRGSSACLLLTGNGLKDINAAMKACGPVTCIEPELKAALAAINALQ